MSRSGRLTLPIEQGMDDTVRELATRWGADAVRNSDGTQLPEIARELAVKIYATRFCARGDQEWALAHPDEAVQIFLSTDRRCAMGAQPLSIRVIDGFLADQIEPDTSTAAARFWQVMDRTTGAPLPRDSWRVDGAGSAATVVIDHPEPFHVYTVSYLAWQRWDSTQIYNYLTNNWAADPTRHKERTYNVVCPQTWAHMKSSLAQWLTAHPEVDVVRFTTFFYHFTLVFNDQAKEKYVDWFGYSASVSVPLLEAFEQQTGVSVRAEDFVDAGYHNNPFRTPTPVFRAWMSFVHRFVTERAAELVATVHQHGRQAMMFLGDNWIGTEPYGEHFAEINLDAVVGSVGSAATCRMISDIPGVRYTEGRMLPYFFPDVFTPGGDPLREANTCWLAARRAMMRSPLDRIGYGGYLSLAAQFPEFVDRVEQICAEFRELHDRTGGATPASASFAVAVVNDWGRVRSWQTHMVAHALPYRQTDAYVGVLEALAGLPLDVRFVSFDDVLTGLDPAIKVLINVGAAGTAFSGGARWAEPALTAALRAFVAAGGGLIGVGEPTAHPGSGAVFQLTEVFGVEREFGWSLSTDRYPVGASEHFVTADGGFEVSAELAAGDVVACGATVLKETAAGSVLLATNSFGDGRAVYLAGLRYSAANARLLHRAVCWAAGRPQELTAGYLATDPALDLAYYPSAGLLLACNNSTDDRSCQVLPPDGEQQPFDLNLPAGGTAWIPVISPH